MELKKKRLLEIEVAGERFERVMEGLIELQKLRREQSGGRVWEEQTHLRRLLHSDLDNYKAQGLGGSIYAKEEFGAMGRSAGAMGKMYQRRLALEGELHQARIGEAKADLEQRQRNWQAMMERVRSRGITAWARALERLEQKRSEWLGRMKDKSRSYAQSWEERRENLARRQQAWAEELLSRAQEAQHEALSGTAAFAGIAGAEGQNAVLRLPSFSGERLSAEGLIKELGQLPMLERLKGLNSGLELRGLPRYRRGVRAEAREFFKKFHDAQTAEREELGKKMLAILIVRTQELWAKLLGQLDQNVAKTNHSYAKRWQKVFGSQGWGYDAGGKNYHKQVLYSATMFNVDSRATQVSAYEYYQWRRDKELEHYILKQQESRFLRKRLQRGATALAGARILEALGKEIDKDELNALNRAGMRFYLGAQQGLLEKVGKAIFSEIAAEEVNWIAGKKKSDWGGGFALWTRDKEEAKLSEKARKKAKWAYYRALESDWESNGLFEKSGAGETGRLTRELLRYQMIHGFGNSQFGLSPKERDLWQAGEHDLIQPLRLGFIEQIAHSIIIAVGTMGIGTALSAVDAISKFGATALTTLAGTGMQVGASFVSSGSNLWGGADPYLEGQKLASALSKSVIAGGLGVLSAGAGEILGEGLVGKVLVDGGLAAGRSMIGGALSSAVLGEALDGKGLLLNAAFAGLGGGIASGLGQMEGLGSLGEDMLNSGVHFGLDTGKAALMALDGDGNFDDTQFLADWGGSFAGNGFSALGSLASYGVRGGLNDYSNQRASDAAEKMKESYTATQSLSKTGLSDDLMDRLGGVGGIFDSFGLLTESMVRGAALGRAQTLDGVGFGVGLGQSIGGFVAMGQSVDSIDSTASLYENGRIIKGYQAGPNVVDGSYQAMLNAYSNAKYNRRMSRADRFAMLRELRERKIEFTNNKAKLASDSKTGQLGTARTEGTISYLNANKLLSSDIGKQLHIATVLSHESARDGRDSPNQQSETRESVRAHWRYQDVLARGRHGRAYVGALDRDQALDFVVGQAYQSGKIGQEEMEAYVDVTYDSSADYLVMFQTRDVDSWYVIGTPQHGFSVLIPDNQDDFDFSEAARERDPRIFELLDENGEGTGRFGFVLSAAFDKFRLKNRGRAAEKTRTRDFQDFINGNTHGNWFIQPPKGLSDTEFIRNILRGDNYYALRKSPFYDIPAANAGGWGEYQGGDTENKYNSNGIQRGLLSSQGAVVPELPNDRFSDGNQVFVAPLYNDPVPNRYFDRIIGPIKPDRNADPRYSDRLAPFLLPW